MKVNSDSNATIAGFQTLRADRDCGMSVKKNGGGVALFVNGKLSNAGHITMKEDLCNPDIELPTVSLRPYDLGVHMGHHQCGICSAFS